MDNDEAPLRLSNSRDEHEDDQDGEDDMPSFNFGAAVAPKRNRTPDHERSSSNFPQQLRYLSIILNSKRRAATQKSFRGSATAWIDQDDSGTYDPKLKRATPPSSLPKNRKRSRQAEDRDRHREPRPRTYRRPVGYRDLFTFSFTKEKALEYLRSITPGPFDLNSENEDNDSGHGGSFPRRRTKRQRNSMRKSTRQDGLTIDHLTNGHPQRRGCKACFESGIDDCTLINDEFEYPCQACEDAGVDCELIISPKLKRICERCKTKRISCSYRYSHGKGVSACEECKEDGFICIAGPLSESSRKIKKVLAWMTPERQLLAPPTTPPPTSAPIRERMYVACNKCRNAEKRCTLKRKVDLGPCSNCRKAGQDCQFVLAPTRSRPVEASSSKPNGKHKSRKSKSVKSSTRVPSTPPRTVKKPGAFHTPMTNLQTLYSENLWPQITKEQRRREKKASYNKGIQNIKITTSFCHPIKFNWVADPMGLKPCDFCPNPYFGLYGLADNKPPKTVEGFYDPAGHGFEEICGGFSELGHKSTKMCVPCTFDRLRITQCEHHESKKLPADEIFDEMAFNNATPEAKEKFLDNAKWCSICPTMATYKCCTVQPHNPLVSECVDEIDGCGLYLCSLCNFYMGNLSKGGVWDGDRMLDLLVGEVRRWERMYKTSKTANKGDAIPLRADAEFLTSKGELIIRINQVMSDKDEDVEDDTLVVISDEVKFQDIDTKPSTRPRFEDIDDKSSNYRKSQDKTQPKIDRKGKGKDLSYFEPGPELKSEGNSRDVDFFETELDFDRKRKGKSKARELSFFEPGREPNSIKKGKSEERSYFEPGPTIYRPAKSQVTTFEPEGNGKAPRRWMSTGRRERERGSGGLGGMVETKREDVERAFTSQLGGVIDLTEDDSLGCRA